MPQTSYAYACARISALEKSILSQATVRRMAESSLEDVMRQLMDAHYGGLPDAQPSDCERMIENERIAAANTIRELSPDPELTDLFLMQTDAQNLKMLVKARMLGAADVQWVEGGLYARDVLTEAVEKQNYLDLPKTFALALDEMERQLKVHFEPQIVSVMIDRGYLAHALKVVETSKEPLAKQYFRALCDFDNMLTFFRMRAMGASKEELKQALLPEAGIRHVSLLEAYDLSSETFDTVLCESSAKHAISAGLADMTATGSIGALEKARDNYLLSLVMDNAHDIMSIFPIVGYLLARDREAKAVRLLLTVKRNGLDDGVIAERLRELYG